MAITAHLSCVALLRLIAESHLITGSRRRLIRSLTSFLPSDITPWNSLLVECQFNRVHAVSLDLEEKTKRDRERERVLEERVNL